MKNQRPTIFAAKAENVVFSETTKEELVNAFGPATIQRIEEIWHTFFCIPFIGTYVAEDILAASKELSHLTIRFSIMLRALRASEEGARKYKSFDWLSKGLLTQLEKQIKAIENEAEFCQTGGMYKMLSQWSGKTAGAMAKTALGGFIFELAELLRNARSGLINWKLTLRVLTDLNQQDDRLKSELSLTSEGNIEQVRAIYNRERNRRAGVKTLPVQKNIPKVLPAISTDKKSFRECKSDAFQLPSGWTPPMT